MKALNKQSAMLLQNFYNFALNAIRIDILTIFINAGILLCRTGHALQSQVHLVLTFVCLDL